MTTLQERAAATAARVPALIDGEAAVQKAGHVRLLAERIGGVADRLAPLVAVAPEFDAGEPAAKAAATAADVAERLGTVLQDAGRAIDADVVAAEKALNAVVESLGQELSRMWQEHRDRTPAPTVDETQLALFEAAGFAVGRLRSRAEALETRRMVLSGLALPRPGDRAGWDEVATGLREVVTDLAGLAPPQVRDFLAAALAPGGAGLDLMTPEVVAFLAERNLTTAFRVVKR